jgi:hypothetical protein
MMIIRAVSLVTFARDVFPMLKSEGVLSIGDTAMRTRLHGPKSHRMKEYRIGPYNNSAGGFGLDCCSALPRGLR